MFAISGTHYPPRRVRVVGSLLVVMAFFASFWGHGVTSLLTNTCCFHKRYISMFCGLRFRFSRDKQSKKQSGEVAEWLKAADCKSARVAYVGSNPTLTTIAIFRSLCVEWLLFRTGKMVLYFSFHQVRCWQLLGTL